MPTRVSWDRYEVALLFSAYERVTNGSDVSDEAERLSRSLRNLAIRRNVAIDDTYRNINGMKMQLANVQYLFTSGESGLSGASALIRQMYDLYMDDLKEWLTDVIDTNGLTALVLLWDEFSSYFKQNLATLDQLQSLVELCAIKPFEMITEEELVQGLRQGMYQMILLNHRLANDTFAC